MITVLVDGQLHGVFKVAVPSIGGISEVVKPMPRKQPLTGH
jgi:hypothetical protein